MTDQCLYVRSSIKTDADGLGSQFTPPTQLTNCGERQPTSKYVDRRQWALNGS